MVDKNGVGATTLGGLTSSANGQLQFWRTTLNDPLSGEDQPSTMVGLNVTVQTWDAAAVNVQFQVSTDSGFGTVVHDQTIVGVAHNVAFTHYVSGLNNNTTYWWRARAVPASGEVLPWSSTNGTFDVVMLSGDAREYIDFNVGVESLNLATSLIGDAREAVDFNVGTEDVDNQDAREMIDFNVGFEYIVTGEGYEYLLEYVLDGTPIPHIWFLKPASGRPSDGIEIVGWGFGDLQGTFDAGVEFDYGVLFGWIDVPVVSWQTFPPNAAAYTEDRQLTQTPLQRDAVAYSDTFDAPGALQSPWISLIGAWAALGGEAAPTTGSGRRVCVIDALSDGDLLVELGTTNAKIAFRVVNDANLLYFDPATRQVRQVIAGTDTQVGSTLSGTAGAIGDTYRVHMIGTGIEVYKNGASIGTVTSSQFQTADRQGMLDTVGTAKFRSVVWDSGIDPDDLIDMQHTKIGIVIPLNALPPGYPVRVHTDGP